MAIIGGVFFILGVIFVIYLNFVFFDNGFFSEDRVFEKKMDANDIHFLEKNYKYYRELQLKDKRKFIKRVNEFIGSKEFEGRKGLVISREMKLLVAATAIRLTFGFNISQDYLIEGLRTIIIYPEQYYSNLTKKYHKGETNSSGVIVLSWNDFMTSLKNEHNNINLGFHEFTHALMLEDIIQCTEAYEILCKEIEQHHLIREIKNVHLLRDYAYTNKMEFISCVIETFFESPELIKKDIPILYDIFVDMLNQDPLEIRYHSATN